MIEIIYDIFLTSKGVSIDSRVELKDIIFFALKGENTDGNQYWKQALDKGASACIVSDVTLKDEENCYYFEDTLIALQTLAKMYKQRVLHIPTLGVTGSNGKTSTKELLVKAMSQKFKVHATKGNYNNHIGLPLTLLSCPPDAQFLILEMGANAPGDIKLLCEIGQPTHGLLTSIGAAHLQGFKNLEGVIRTKFELFNYLDQTGGQCFVNRFDENIAQNRKMKGTDVYWREKLELEGDVFLSLVNTSPFVRFELQYPDNTSIKKTTKLTGIHNWYNMLNTFLVANHFGIDPETIGSAIAQFQPDNNRSQWVKYGEATVLMDAYNANPSSVRAVLAEFAHLSTKLEKQVILGAMGELGDQSDSLHRQILTEMCDLNQFSYIYLVGKAFMDVMKETDIQDHMVAVFPDVETLSKTIGNSLFNQPKLILVKGSRSIGLERLFDSSQFKGIENID